MKAIHLTPAEISTLKARIAAGELRKDLAAELGIDSATLSKLVGPDENALRRRAGLGDRDTLLESYMGVCPKHGYRLMPCSCCDPWAE